MYLFLFPLPWCLFSLSAQNLTSSTGQVVPLGRSISVKSLRADPNGKADREFEYALWYVRDKNYKSAIKHFEKALTRISHKTLVKDRQSWHN